MNTWSVKGCNVCVYLDLFSLVCSLFEFFFLIRVMLQSDTGSLRDLDGLRNVSDFFEFEEKNSSI